MRVRRIERDDLPLVRRLRNDNRHWFFDDREISQEEHEAWYASLAERGVDFFVLEEDGRVIGTISVSERHDGREVGNLTLDEDYRGRGLMTEAVRQVCSGPGPYFARVKHGNGASAAVFERASFSSYLYFERR